MGSWVDEETKQAADRIWAASTREAAPLLDDEIERAIRQAVVEAARRCAAQMPDNGAGDARLAAAHAAILAMLTEEVPRG